MWPSFQRCPPACHRWARRLSSPQHHLKPSEMPYRREKVRGADPRNVDIVPELPGDDGDRRGHNGLVQCCQQDGQPQPGGGQVSEGEPGNRYPTKTSQNCRGGRGTRTVSGPTASSPGASSAGGAVSSTLPFERAAVELSGTTWPGVGGGASLPSFTSANAAAGTLGWVAEVSPPPTGSGAAGGLGCCGPVSFGAGRSSIAPWDAALFPPNTLRRSY